jgi:hypothetical protein
MISDDDFDAIVRTLGELRELALDATARKGHRVHSRTWLRAQLKKKIRAVEALLAKPAARPASGEGGAP